MDMTLLFYLTKATMIALLLCWVVRLSEEIVVGIASDFWDAYAACFLALIGITAVSVLLYYVLYRIWWMYEASRVVFVVIAFYMLFRVILKHRTGQNLVLAVIASVTLGLLIYGFSQLGIAI